MDTKFNLDALANAVILHAIEDLGADVLDDEGILDWVDAFEINPEVIRHGIEAMPLKDGKPNAKPAIRRIMEALDAREEMVEVEVYFGMAPIANLETEPSPSELNEIEVEETD